MTHSTKPTVILLYASIVAPIWSNQLSKIALLGTNRGSKGRTILGLPGLRGRAAMHLGQGPGLSPYQQGQHAGIEQVGLTESEVPADNHT